MAVKLSAGFGVLVSGLEYASFLHQGYLSNLYKALGGCEDCTIFWRGPRRIILNKPGPKQYLILGCHFLQRSDRATVKSF